MNDERIAELLERWGDLRKGGSEVQAEELCRDCPELLPEIRRRIEALKATEWLELPLDDDDAGQASPKHTPEEHGLPAVLGRYRLDSLVGVGGFGQVWKAFDPELQRTVAVKVTRPDRMPSPQRAEAFLAEARRVALLSHPGIVPVYDVGRAGGFCYIVSEFIEGGSLAERLATRRFAAQEAVGLVAELADILHHAHGQGFLHRDIKPANILLGENGKPFLTDFGIACREEDFGQGATSTEGTLAYMSPEQVRGDADRLDARTDIYSLGVVLYELLTGRLPFVADDPALLQESILSARPEPPRTSDGSIPASVERVCLAALAKDPASRFPTAREFADALRASVGRKRRWLKATILGLLAFVVLGVAGVVTWRVIPEYRKAHEEGQKAIRTGQVIAGDIRKQLQKELGPSFSGSKPPGPTAATRPSGPLRLGLMDSSLDLTGRAVTDADFKAIGRHLVLKRLVLANTPTTSKHLASLRRNSILERLDLSGTQITDAGLDQLASLPMLQNLSLSNTVISNAGVEQLGHLQIRTLDLTGTKITDSGLTYLTDQYGPGGYLMTLDLTNTVVTDGCIGSLAKMKKLQELRIGGTGITDEGIAKLKIALPRCKVER